MNGQTDVDLDRLVRTAGQDWLLDSFDEPGSAAGRLRQQVDEAEREYDVLYPPDGPFAPRLSLNSLASEVERNPQNVAAFLQAAGSTSSARMLVMVWRLLNNDQILRLKLLYELGQKAVTLEIELKSDLCDHRVVFQSAAVEDVALLRHVGILRLGDQPILDGFYALRA